jgi:DNA-binding XRE family transcriptional regulator
MIFGDEIKCKMFGLGKSRTKLGVFLDQIGKSQEWLIKNSGVNKNTITQLCNNKDYVPSGNTKFKILTALRKIDPNIEPYDFWN